MTFSACFGGPFMVHHPYVYADLLRKKMLQHGGACWLVNTGWTGGPFGIGKRISIGHTRKLLNAALSGALEKVSYRRTRSSASTCRRAARASRPRSSSPPTPGAPRGVLQEVRRPRRPLHRELQGHGRRLPAGRRRPRPEAAQRGAGKA